jgi:hypothetical protein
VIACTEDPEVIDEALEQIRSRDESTRRPAISRELLALPDLLAGGGAEPSQNTGSIARLDLTHVSDVAAPDGRCHWITPRARLP